ncbi:MAG TPA: DUF3488 and transglutaminase-like domain-containing protein [Longimicrobiales bacterium]|nr:DUF3488 and transglutaminase-like domain-containing protein [Longimicrobiales bacterium]
MNGSALRLARLHRRLTVAMALAALTAFAAGAGLPLAVTAATAALLVLAFVWQPGPELSEHIERGVLVIATLLVLWALYQVFVVTDDIVAPVVALLLILLVGEALRSLDARNDVRLYTLSFALLVAATAYLPGVVFAAAFIAFVLFTTFALMVGHVRREAERHGGSQRGIDRAMLRTTIALSLVTLGMGALVFLAFPRLPRNIFGRGITAPGVSMAGFSDEVSIGQHGSRIYANPEVVLRVEFPTGDSTIAPGPAAVADMYWRGRSYDAFDGVRWIRNTRRMPRAFPPEEWYRSWGVAAAAERQADHRIYPGALDARVLFGLHPILDVLPRSDFRPIRDAVGDLMYVSGGTPIYTVRSGWISPAPDRLRSAAPDSAPDPPRLERTLSARLDQVALQYYVQLPPLTRRVHALADSLTARHASQYDRVLAVQRWLQTSFAYTLDLPDSQEEATLDHFLFVRRAGHCEYFSTALAVLLRAQGIPTRNVNGFLGGQWNEFGRYLSVTQNDAHSWVEVWFPDIGWVPFDATPAGSTAALARGSDLLAPLRSLFNGMQHRWSKWVIDYNLDRQVELFGRVSELFSREAASRRPEQSGERRGLSWRLAIFLTASFGVVVLLIRLLRGRGARLRPESRSYLKLRRAYAREGWDDESLAAPRSPRPGAMRTVAPPTRPRTLSALEWLSALRRAGAPAQDVAEAVIGRYLDARYGGQALSAGEARALDEDVARARSRLREAVSRTRAARAFQ